MRMYTAYGDTRRVVYRTVTIMRMYTAYGDARRVVYRTVTIMRMYTVFGDTRRAELQACAYSLYKPNKTVYNI